MTTTDELAELNRMRDEGNAAHDHTETWCKQGEIGHIVLGGGPRVRYLRVGSGPPLLLMHTVRTQLDHFQLVIPRIADAFTVYAVDFPGMGWSDIVAGASYEEPALRAAMVSVIEELDLSNLTLAGESMGATLALTLSVDLRDRVRRVVAFIGGDPNLAPTVSQPLRIGSSRAQSGATSTTIETGERRDDPACRQRGPFGHPATSTGADELTSLVDDPLFCHRCGQAALATEPAVSGRLAGAARCALREPVDEEVEQELFGEVLDWRNARLADGVQRALGREPRDFSEFAREAAAGVWDV